MIIFFLSFIGNRFFYTKFVKDFVWIKFFEANHLSSSTCFTHIGALTTRYNFAVMIRRLNVSVISTSRTVYACPLVPVNDTDFCYGVCSCQKTLIQSPMSFSMAPLRFPVGQEASIYVPIIL